MATRVALRSLVLFTVTKSVWSKQDNFVIKPETKHVIFVLYVCTLQ